MDHRALFRRLLLIATAGLALSAVLIVVLVLPALRHDPSPLATPRRAMIGTSIVALLTLALAALNYRQAWRCQFRGSGWRWGVLTLTLPALLVTIAVLDGALALWGHGETMHVAAGALWVCTGANFVAAMLMIVAASLRPASVRPGPTELS